MATTTEVKNGLDRVAERIGTNRDVLEKVVSNAAIASTALGDIPTDFAAIKAEIDLYTPTGAFETLAKDELARITTEFQALKVHADAIAAVDLDA